MKYKVILFDADGVTINSEMMFSEKLAKDRGIPKEKMTPFFTGPFQKCMFGEADLKEELVKVIDDWGWEGSVDDLLKAWFDFENSPDTEMLDYVQELRGQGVRCYLATNQEKYRGNYLREEMNFKNLFDGLFISAEVGYKKKDPKFFEAVYNTLNEASKYPSSTLLERHEIFFTDDEEENIEAAKTFGIKARLFTNIKDFKKWDK